MTRTANRRSGFTLVELLVAVALAIVILGLVIYIVNSATFDSYKVVGAGDRLSQWLIQAKYRAMRDEAPRGLRLYINNGVVTDCALIEEPQAWAPPNPNVRLHFVYLNDGTTRPTGNNNRRVFVSFANSLLRDDFTNAVSAGDLLQIPELGYSARLLQIIPVATGPAPPGVPAPPSIMPRDLLAELILDDSGVNWGPGVELGAAYSNTAGEQNQSTLIVSNFGIYRRSQEVLGEPTLLLPRGMVVDMGASATGLPTTGVFDILFSPSGQVFVNGAQSGFIGLLLRDANKLPGQPTVALPAQYDLAGEMVIVAIYTKTGMVATFPVANGPDPFLYAKEAVNAGL
jgi:Tfp pilus assembly protein FimT